MKDSEKFVPGNAVKFVAPQSTAERSERFTVLEVNGDRVRVQFICDMQIKPTFVYRTADLVKA